MRAEYSTDRFLMTVLPILHCSFDDPISIETTAPFAKRRSNEAQITDKTSFDSISLTSTSSLDETRSAITRVLQTKLAHIKAQRQIAGTCVSAGSRIGGT